MGNFSLNWIMTLYDEFRIVGLGDTILGNNETWESTADPIVVSVLVYAIRTDRLE